MFPVESVPPVEHTVLQPDKGKADFSVYKKYDTDKEEPKYCDWVLLYTLFLKEKGKPQLWIKINQDNVCNETVLHKFLTDS